MKLLTLALGLTLSASAFAGEVNPNHDLIYCIEGGAGYKLFVVDRVNNEITFRNNYGGNEVQIVDEIYESNVTNTLVIRAKSREVIKINLIDDSATWNEDDSARNNDFYSNCGSSADFDMKKLAKWAEEKVGFRVFR